MDGQACQVPSGEVVHVVDLWQTNLEQPGLQGPAHGYNNSCVGGMAGGSGNAEPTPDDFGSGDRIGDTCYRHGPKSDHWYGGYEDALFEQQVLRTVAEHNPATPYFLFWAPHIVHTPLQVPDEFYKKFAFVAEDDKPTHERQTYHAMVDFADAAIGNFTEAIKAKGMWDDMIIVFSADNGGPVYHNGTAGANNYPLKGGPILSSNLLFTLPPLYADLLSYSCRQDGSMGRRYPCKCLGVGRLPPGQGSWHQVRGLGLRLGLVRFL